MTRRNLARLTLHKSEEHKDRGCEDNGEEEVG